MAGISDAAPHPGDALVQQTSPGPSSVAPAAGRWILVATILGSSIASIDGTVVNVALPSMQRSLHATAGDLQWVIEAYSLFLSALILVGGSLGDRLGRQRMFAAGIILFTIASVACGLAPNVVFLISARAVQGVGGALLVPGSLSIISASFDESIRGRAIGTWAGFSTIATAIGPVLGGWLVQNVSWRWVFFINVPIAALTLAIVILRVPESRDAGLTGRLDWLGAVLATLALGAIVYALIDAGTRGLSSSRVLLILAAGVGLLGAFVVVEWRSRSPMVPLGVFRSRVFSGTNLLTLLLYGALGGSLYFLPFDLQQIQGYSPTEAGAAFLPFTVIVFVLSRWAGGLVTRYGARKPLIMGPIITAAGFALFARPDIGGSYWTTFFPAVVVMSLGMTLVISPLTTAVMGALDSNQSGVASGVNNAVARAAGLLAIAVFGLVVASVFGTRLDARLGQLHTSSVVHSALDAQKSKLAGAQVPANVPPVRRAELTRAVREAFVDGFRIAMLMGAAMAIVSALFAATLINDTEPETTAQRTS